MSADYFQFKQFIVHHRHSTMKVGTDAVLLATLANLAVGGQLLEVGCGSGVISLIAAQRSQMQITAIDIDRDSVWEARANFKNSPWNKRLQALMISYQEFASRNNPIRFDCILSNPPFFVNDLKSPDAKRNLARHTDTLSYRDFLLASRNFISESGKLWLILPQTEALLFIEEAKSFGFYLRNRIDIAPKPNKETNRIILCFANERCKEIESRKFYIRDNDNRFSEEYRTLTHDFYTNLKDN